MAIQSVPSSSHLDTRVKEGSLSVKNRNLQASEHNSILYQGSCSKIQKYTFKKKNAEKTAPKTVKRQKICIVRHSILKIKTDSRFVQVAQIDSTIILRKIHKTFFFSKISVVFCAWCDKRSEESLELKHM